MEFETASQVNPTNVTVYYVDTGFETNIKYFFIPMLVYSRNSLHLLTSIFSIIGMNPSSEVFKYLGEAELLKLKLLDFEVLL